MTEKLRLNDADRYAGLSVHQRFQMMTQLCGKALAMLEPCEADEVMEDLYGRFHSIKHGIECNPRGWKIPPHFKKNYLQLKTQFENLKAMITNKEGT